MADKFRARGYKDKDIITAFEHADSLVTKDITKYKPSKRKTQYKYEDNFLCLSFSTTFSRQSQSTREMFLKHWKILTLDKDIASIIQGGPRFIYKKAKTLGSHLSPSLFN
ncbi:hypothetical protein FKM82_022700 [Ascaphus truei]